jgi:hypothetical protein
MKQFTIGIAILACLTLSTTGLSAQATHTAFTGGIGFINPCNGEVVIGSGPVKIVYAETPSGHISIHSTFKVAAKGNQGHTYVMSFLSNASFDAPSGTGPGYVYFDAPIHAQVVATAKALNFAWNVYGRLFVVDGVVTGSTFIGPSTTTCQGQ